MPTFNSLSWQWTWLSLNLFVGTSSATFMMSGKPPSMGISLDVAGLVALADLTVIARRTAITGSASFLDVLFLAPGIHRQQTASEANCGELPQTAALTTGYVFRVENQATVSYLQTVGKSGHLVQVVVERVNDKDATLLRRMRCFFLYPSAPVAALYLTGPILTITALLLLLWINDYWGIGIVGILMLARLCNVFVIRRRSRLGWKGAPEPGVRGDLLVVLSQDRWIRMKGEVDDLKAVTAGQWLQDMSAIEGLFVAVSTLLVYVVAALAGNATRYGSLIILTLLLISAAVLGLCNSIVGKLRLYGRVVSVVGEPERYSRRLDLVNQLIEEHKRDDWAIGLGMIRVKVKDSDS